MRSVAEVPTNPARRTIDLRMRMLLMEAWSARAPEGNGATPVRAVRHHHSGRRAGPSKQRVDPAGELYPVRRRDLGAGDVEELLRVHNRVLCLDEADAVILSFSMFIGCHPPGFPA